MLTLREYQERSLWRRLSYRLYRHPLVLFGIGPAYLFILQHRLPVGLMRCGFRPWLSTMSTNLAIAIIVAGLMCLIGMKAFLLVHLPIMFLAASAGVWLFYVQHQFEHTTWAEDPDWKVHQAALHGSSHYDLPAMLRWLTANIGVHHVHHLCSRIPYYRLPQALREHPELRGIGRLTRWQSFGSCDSFCGTRTSAGWYLFEKPVHKLNRHHTPDINPDVFSSPMATVEPFMSLGRVSALQVESEILPSFRPFEYCR